MKTNSQIKRRLESQLGPQAVVVIKPDHPFLAVGPDILIGHNGHLMSVFRQGKNETEERLLSRLMATRIAMPRSVCVLLSQNAFPHFDFCFLDDDLNIAEVLSCTMGSLPMAGHYNNPKTEIITEINRLNREQYPYGGFWVSLEDAPQKAKEAGLEIFLTEHPSSVDWKEDWLKAVMKANEFEGYTVVPKPEPLVMVTGSWPSNVPAGELANRFGLMNILCLSVNYTDEIEDALKTVRDFEVQETITPRI